MKSTSVLMTAIAVCALSTPMAFAQDKTAPAKPAMNMDMGKPAQESAAPAKPAMGMDMDMDKQMPKMQANMEKMQQQMEKIGKTKDPKEHHKLMKEHMQTMQENMKAMRGMGGPAMKGGGERPGMAMGAPKAGGMPGGDVNTRQDMTEKRMDMMQMMMEQMMQRDQAMQPMPHM